MMKLTEEQMAINRLLTGNTAHSCKADYIKLAIKALEKQVPKKILYRKQNYGTPWLCCECEADQTPTEFFCEDGSEPKEKHTFCWKCGQKLDWSDRA